MKLYSDKLTNDDVTAAARKAGVTLADAKTIRRPRVRRYGWILHLSGSSSYRSQATGEPAATWDEHGVFMAELYKRDPKLRIAFYRDLQHFLTFTTKARDSFHNRELPEGRKVRAPWLEDRTLLFLAGQA